MYQQNKSFFCCFFFLKLDIHWRLRLMLKGNIFTCMLHKSGMESQGWVLGLSTFCQKYIYCHYSITVPCTLHGDLHVGFNNSEHCLACFFFSQIPKTSVEGVFVIDTPMQVMICQFIKNKQGLMCLCWTFNVCGYAPVGAAPWIVYEYGQILVSQRRQML